MTPDQIMTMEAFPMLVQSVRQDGIGDLFVLGGPLLLLFIIWLVVLVKYIRVVEAQAITFTAVVMIAIVLMPVLVTRESWQKAFAPEGYVLRNYENITNQTSVEN
jgi:hypothetical protein